MRFTSVLLCALFYFASCEQVNINEINPEKEGKLSWNPFSDDVFKKAQSQNKFVLLHIEAQWCHWCHVMEDSTYSDPQVQQYLSENFILAKEDQDSRPDLFTKYRSYGWPAIILFNQDANEILKLRGYKAPDKFLSLITAALQNPTIIKPEVAPASAQKVNSDSLNIDEMLKLFLSRTDFEKGSFRTFKKSLFAAGIEMAFLFSSESDSLKTWLKTSIENSYQLMDSEWGGIFQYSTNSDWKNAHYERLLRVQAEHIIHYCRYGSLFNDSAAIKKAEFIYDYCNEFLSLRPPLFNNSQDADFKKGTESTSYYKLKDKERRELGIPVTHEVQFLKENAMMVRALIHLWAATGSEKYFVRAEKVINVLRSGFKNSNGLYQRSTNDSTIFSLDDNLAMLDALILAHQISGRLLFLNEAENLADKILEMFTNKNETLNAVCGDLTLESSVLGSSNINAAITFHHLAQILRNENLEESAKNLADNYLKSTPDYSEYFIPFRLLKSKYMDDEPLHAVLIIDQSLTILEKEMLQQLLALSAPDLVIERVDLNNMTPAQEVLYGSSEPGTLFICNSTFCSSPIRDAREIRSVLFPENKETMLPGQHGFSNALLKN